MVTVWKWRNFGLMWFAGLFIGCLFQGSYLLAGLDLIALSVIFAYEVEDVA